MIRTKDFYLKKIYNLEGKKIGTIKDIYINFYEKKLEGFEVSNTAFFSKKNYISIDDVMDVGEDIVAKDLKNGNGLKFKDIKDLDVMDTHSKLKGAVEDLLIDRNNYTIKAMIITSGFIDKILKGKEVILLNECILGDDYILYTGKENISFKSIPHNMTKYEFDKKI
ncbi:photosystem reaction center subunit H [Clostridium botulinum]|uniref:PRC-barrel domain-containing protein n=1 Tax=Clostridium TaxID=1485 RepID=UPI00050055E3|nr:MULTISPECIES: PRC-barrel domain-containing protein [unclassified Clostridium]AIY82030.1 PRC-barrel domain protein [Clostridium botulinum 202F]KAI3348523.1 PRC-barrel domain-containing protein [Clostridium botulinum]KFX58205.1 photosystem reaction center subunit H [Clostridium botulinum]KON12655.1 photosystem reaction center subunit H [Clostridium botulinum]MBN1038095.1 photosystem reaction center subunit H [Clostridium botulinum]